MALLFGFHKLSDQQLALPAIENIPLVNDAGKLALDAHNAGVQAIMDRLVFDTRQPQLRFTDKQRSGELQPLDENGRAVPRRTGKGVDYTIGLPLEMAGDAVGETWLARLSQTVLGVNDTLQDMTNSHLNWLRRKVLEAFFQKDDYPFIDTTLGELTVKGLANDDDIKYAVRTSGAVATDNHLLAQVDDIDNTHNPFPEIVREIKEHPENTGDVLVFVPTALFAQISELGSYFEYDDPALTYGIDSVRLTATAPATPFGEVKGYVSGLARCWIALWDELDDVGDGSRMIAMSTGGPRPIARRLPDIARLGSFGPLDTRNDFPYYESQYGVMNGFGAYNRVAALIYQIGAADYTVPAGYTRRA